MNSNSKSTISIILFVLLCFATTIAHADYICGDANSDGDLNVSDAVYLINYVFIFGSPAPAPNCCGYPCGGTVTDYDGNFYRTVRIGDQCWMMDNLKVTHYRNGDPIPNVTDAGEWHSLGTGASCDYNNDPANADIYGRLYNFYAVTDIRNIAPEGWHVATDEDWQTLVDFLGGEEVAGGKLKLPGTTYWLDPNTGATNESGCTALPGGYRSEYGSFTVMGNQARFWTSTMNGSANFGWYYFLSYDSLQSVRTWLYAQFGLSVRCVKDQ
jgi:uncharacterized protein (TIGR02145 family)